MKAPFRSPLTLCTQICAILLAGVLLAAQASAQNADTKTVSLACKPSRANASGRAADNEAFQRDLAAFSAEMTARHRFDPEDLDCLFGQLRHNDTVLRLVMPFPAGTPKNWQIYRARFVEPVRIAAGATFWKRHKKALEKAERIYGIPPEIVIGIIGIETLYGKNKGKFRILDALATLAFDYPEHPKREARMALFKNELENALLLSSELGISPLSLKGSYAGAIGWPQFLPSSVRKYAIDFDGNGKIDLINSPVDAIGSIANFLAQHGWKKGMPITFPAGIQTACEPSPKAAKNQELAAGLTQEDLRQNCITAKTPLPDNLRFGLIDLQNGLEPTEYWLGTDNFFAVTFYNRSYFYAMSVIDLGKAVRAFRENDAE